jgi:hypothetical protein
LRVASSFPCWWRDATSPYWDEVLPLAPGSPQGRLRRPGKPVRPCGLPASRPTSRPAGKVDKQIWTRKGPDAPRRRRD